MVSGARVSLLIATAIVLISGVFGVLYGALSGYWGGIRDIALQKVVETFWAFPPILLALAILAFFGQSLTNIILALSIQRWIPYCRIARAQALVLRNKEFVAASQVMGGGTTWVVSRHILPNLVAAAIVIATFSMATAILAEASLSFLGLGVPPEIPTWGGMLAEGRSYVVGRVVDRGISRARHLHYGARPEPARRLAARPARSQGRTQPALAQEEERLMFLQEYGEKWVDVDGIRTRYFEAGSGRRVVLVHGGTKGDASGGANAEDFHLNFAELAKKFHVISVDRLGQGYTDNPKRDEDWTMAASVRHFVGLPEGAGQGPLQCRRPQPRRLCGGAHHARLSAPDRKLRADRLQHRLARPRPQRDRVRDQPAQGRHARSLALDL